MYVNCGNGKPYVMEVKCSWSLYSMYCHLHWAILSPVCLSHILPPLWSEQWQLQLGMSMDSASNDNYEASRKVLPWDLRLWFARVWSCHRLPLWRVRHNLFKFTQFWLLQFPSFLSRFTICQDGQLCKYRCPEGFLFDPRDNLCKVRYYHGFDKEGTQSRLFKDY